MIPLRFTVCLLGSASLLFASACGPFRSLPRTNPLVPQSGDSVVVMDFAEPISLDPLASGWYHRTFSGPEPMDISYEAKDGRAAIRLATDGSASMLFRFVDIPIDAYPRLTWDWQVEQGVVSELDERTPEGDDHPARFYLKFLDVEGEEHSMEIIWGNRELKAGEWLHLGFLFGWIEFPHYVANAGEENEGAWHPQDVDLRELYRVLWGDPTGVRLTELALFCDTDQTGAKSVAYFSHVQMKAAAAPVP